MFNESITELPFAVAAVADGVEPDDDKEPDFPLHDTAISAITDNKHRLSFKSVFIFLIVILVDYLL